MKKFARILCALIISVFAVLSCGCIGNDSNYHKELIDKFNNGEITEDELLTQLQNNQQVPLYGTKVLYRPDHYDYNEAVGEGNEEYYGQYAWRILSTLTNVYGIVNKTNPLFGVYIPNNVNYQNYFYDSIRYNVYSQEEYKLNKKIIYKNNTSGGTTTTNENIDEDFVKISVNMANAWNWSFSDEAEPIGFINITNNVNSIGYVKNNNIISNSYESDESGVYGYFKSIKDDYYGLLEIQQAYLSAYLGEPNAQSNITAYSDYVKALEYVIYCITLDLTPANISVTLDAAGMPVVSVAGFSATADKTSVTLALDYIKNIFDKIGTTVGFPASKVNKLSDYILKNVIGDNAINNDTVKITSYDTLIEYQDKDGNVIDTQYSGATSTQTITVGSNYKNVVNQIVNDVFENVRIGSETDDTINNRYLASEIVDYFGDNFLISADDEFANIRPLEYQSAVLMFREEFLFDNLMLHFKYDAGMDGDETYDKDASITINVKINYYKKGGEWQQLKQEKITVKDGPFDYGSESNTLLLFGLSKDDPRGITISPFTTEIGGGVMKCMEYDGKTDISNPIKLLGTTKLKTYYKVVEPELGELENAYYTYGILDHTKFAGNDGCDYLEIAYEVVKTTGDYKTNYKFYTGLGTVA